MKIDARTVLADYQALRGAASAGQTQASVSLSATPSEIVSSRLDNDPSTLDELVASTWSGSFSDPGGQITFKEIENRLEVECLTRDSLMDEGSLARATIDTSSQRLLAHTDSDAIQFVDGAIVAAPPAPPTSPEEKEAAALRQTYAEIKSAVERGDKEFSAGVSSYELVEARPGYIQVTSWDGGFSSPTVTETFQEVDNTLHYTRFTPGSPFMVGSEDQTFTRIISL